MTKKIGIVYNACYGGFGLSAEAVKLYNELAGTDHADDWPLRSDETRADPNLVKVVEQLGSDANDWAAHLKIKYLNRGTRYKIIEYDGREEVYTMDDLDQLAV